MTAYEGNASPTVFFLIGPAFKLPSPFHKSFKMWTMWGRCCGNSRLSCCLEHPQPTSHIRVLRDSGPSYLGFGSCSLLMHLGGSRWRRSSTWVLATHVGHLGWAPGSSLAQPNPSCCSHFGSEPADGGSLFSSLSSSFFLKRADNALCIPILTTHSVVSVLPAQLSPPPWCVEQTKMTQHLCFTASINLLHVLPRQQPSPSSDLQIQVYLLQCTIVTSHTRLLLKPYSPHLSFLKSVSLQIIILWDIYHRHNTYPYYPHSRQVEKEKNA